MWNYSLLLDGSEFAAGTVTGPVLKMSNLGMLLFMAALPMGFLRVRRIWALTALLASLLCLPLHLYFAIPGPFQRVVRGEYSAQLTANVVWEPWLIAGILAMVIAFIFGLRDLLNPARKTL